MEYRPEIDGLRAVAVIPVIFFHAGFEIFSGGFVGVDVFFVISGYLITSIIHLEISRGRFSIGRFYERRIRRLVPALLLVLVTTSVFAWRWMLPMAYEGFSKSLIAANLFVSNIQFWRGDGYFSEVNELKPLLHTWSLAVEEHFYLIFPPLLLLVSRLRGRNVVWVVASITVASLALSEWASTRHSGANFYLLPTRFWELGIGALIALTALDTRRRKWARPISELAAITGLAMISYAVFTYDAHTPFPGFFALPPVLGTALIICFTTQETLVGRLLSLRPMVLVGLISYGAYLWHYPIFALARIRVFGEIGTSGYLALSALSLVLAYVSWRYLEAPLRDRQRTSRRQVFTFAAAVSCVLIVVGAAGVVTRGLPQRLDPAVVTMANLRETQDWLSYQCRPTGNPLSAENCVHGDFPRRIALWGDSVAASLAPGLAEVLSENEASLVSLILKGCTPVMDWNPGLPDCDSFRNVSLSYLTQADGKEEIVVLSGRWLNLLGTPSREVDDGEDGVFAENPWVPKLSGLSGENPRDPRFVERVQQLVNSTVRLLLDSGRRVVLLYDIPELGYDVPGYRAKAMLFGVDKPNVTAPYAAVREVQSVGTKFLDGVGEHPNLLRVYPNQALCDRQVPDRCVGEFEGQELYLDNRHLSRAGAILVGREVQKAIAARGW